MIFYAKIFISDQCTNIINTKLFEAISLIIIILNSFVLVYNSYQDNNRYRFDNLFLLFYTIEMCLKIIGKGLFMNKVYLIL